VKGFEQSNYDIPNGVSLRTELSLRSLKFAAIHGLLHERTDGEIPSIIFGCSEDGRHGNFHPLAYQRICSNPLWARRLEKAHTAAKKAWPRSEWRWKELDCANSSDALLMNIFCYPGVIDSTNVQSILGIEFNATPEFGYKPRTPLHGNKRDNTEIDMKLGNLLIEAKLTESDFQSARSDLICRYRDIENVFHLSELELENGRQASYQLIRGVLAAYAVGCAFCVFCDTRRPDLIEAWYRIMRTVRQFELRCQLKLLTWQELASVLPEELQRFLADKYGIVPV
jgi:hypothetical protein